MKDYLRQHYCSHDERSDLYVYFMERDLSILCKGGRMGMIVSNKFLRANYGRNVRSHIVQTANVERILDLADCGISQTDGADHCACGGKGGVKTAFDIHRRRRCRNSRNSKKKAARWLRLPIRWPMRSPSATWRPGTGISPTVGKRPSLRSLGARQHRSWTLSAGEYAWD